MMNLLTSLSATQSPYSPIFSYVDCISRHHAIEEGFLIDISYLSKRYFKTPVAITREVWDALIALYGREPFRADNKLLCILSAASKVVKHSAKEVTEAYFDVRQSTKRNDKVCLKISVGPTDNINSDPALTIMLAEQPTLWCCHD